MSEPILKRVVVIESSTLGAISRNREFLTEFPFLASLHGQHLVTQSNCGGCRGRRQSVSHAQALDHVKSAIVNMGDDKKRRFKELLKTKQVKVVYRLGNQIVEHVF